MRTIEKWILVAASAILVISVANFFYRTTALKHLDSVFLFESTLNILDSGRPVSQTVSTYVDLRETFEAPIEKLCQSDWERKTLSPYNVINNHAYFALYPIALLAKAVGPESSFAFLNALAHILLLVVPFFFLRSRGIGIGPSFIFTVCIALYPAWSNSSVGDYYLDRLYMPFALLSLCFMHRVVQTAKGQTNPYLLLGMVASVVAAAAFTERATLMMIGTVAFFLFFFPQARKNAVVRNILLSLLVLLGAYLFIYFKFFFAGLEEGGGLLSKALTTFSDPSGRFHAPGWSAFIAVNVLFLGLFIPFAGARYIALALGAIAPNILISIGGAELNGWTTHYHAMYMPFIIFVAMIGYIQILNRFHGRASRFLLLVGIVAFVSTASARINPFTGGFEDPSFASTKDNVFAKMYRFYFRPDKSYERVALDAVKTLDVDIPPKVKVSAIEGAMPVLYRSRSLSLYPIDIYTSNYVVISGAVNNGRVSTVAGAITYLGTNQLETLNRCLLQKMIEKGFLLYRAVPAVGLLIFKRV
ncbi:DUF2079 domain-containing protein [Noviherbaspirillum sp. UKPF54]|uniref:DUF2079 domain-containing protein n=1 Tax=Noviherbaspirillum sp. UKPF54 TaxID=2601898 RepID=UPI0011B173FB|nr:DUF2079 domain-containing protein [Noviherbaspirillum sp. UKPF54]QDZ28847.1 DUF2079 domain-containing protein [Noviherbaspirillum sp. UKPF54]